MRMSGRTAGTLAVVMLCAGSQARAQEEPAPPPPAPRPQEEPPPPPVKPRPDGPLVPGAQESPLVDVTAPDFLGFALGDVSEGIVVGDERVVAATGTVTQPVRIRLEGFEVRCESIVMWGDRDRLVDAIDRRREVLKGADPDTVLGPLIHAVYAEGGVVALMKGREIRCDRLFLDFQRGRAYFVRATLTAELEGREGKSLPLTIRADVIRATARDRYRAENAQVTTCTYSDPHYQFETKSIDVDYRHAWATFETSWWPTIRVDTLLGDDTPVLVFPKLGGNSGLASTPLQGVGFSHGSRFGTAVEVTWGGDIRREDGTKWGDWRLSTDYRSSRGPGAGVDVTHKGTPSKPGGKADEFEFSSYWQRDSQDFDNFSDRAFDGGKNRDGSDRNRGFAHLFDRWYVEDPSVVGAIGSGWRVDTEVSYYSDPGYFAEYDQRKVETEKQQETYIEARKIWGNQAVAILGSYRLNDEAAYLDRKSGDLFLTNFENQTQYLPSATYHLINEPIVGYERTGIFPVNFSMQASAANVKRRYDERTARKLDDAYGWTGEYVTRGDVETRFTMPFSLGDFHVNPAFGGSMYGVDEANGFAQPDEGSEGRWSAFWDLHAGTQAWQAFPDVKDSFFDLDGLRHIASVDAQYFDRFKVSDDAQTFQDNDLIDQLAEQRIASLRLRNRLQTKRDGEVEDWLDWEARWLYFFDRNEAVPESPFGVREDFPAPLQTIDFPGESKYSHVSREGSAYWQHRARLQLLRKVWLVGEADYDMQANAMETSAAGVRWFADDRLSIYVGRRTIHSDSTIWTERFEYRLSNRWGVALEYQEDTKAGRGLRTMVSLHRRAHDYTIAVEIESDKQGNSTAVGLAIYPNDWSSSRNDPFSLRRPLDYDALKWYR